MSVGVMHLVDSLAFGGTEKVAVTLANALPTSQYRAYLCSTRETGPLAEAVAPHVPVFCLERKGRFDMEAARRLLDYARRENITLFHAHSSSLFFARFAALFAPKIKTVWHDHYGFCEVVPRGPAPYRIATRGIGAVVAVNDTLANWAKNVLHVPSGKVFYLPNFVTAPESGKPAELPGNPGRRIICVANMRPQKDHFLLLKAFRMVAERVPDAHLFLVGSRVDDAYAAAVEKDLPANVHLLGPQKDVFAHLLACDVAVLSSASEGLPLSLLEYGLAGLPSVATRVGQCAEVLDQGRVGGLVDSGDADGLAAVLLEYLENPARRREMGAAFRAFVQQKYSREGVIQTLTGIYDSIQ